MPTVRHQLPRGRFAELTEYQLATLLDQDRPEPSTEDTWWLTTASGCADPGLAWHPWSLAALWRDHEAALMAAWIAGNPGKRPSVWWSYAAPRAAAGHWPAWLDRELPEPRRRLGGKGTPRHEVLAEVPLYWLGMPDRWITVEDLHTWPNLMAEPYDPADPPIYESQAEYLRRHGLFLPGERRRLRKAHFEPEAAGDDQPRD